MDENNKLDENLFVMPPPPPPPGSPSPYLPQPIYRPKTVAQENLYFHFDNFTNSVYISQLAMPNPPRLQNDDKYQNIKTNTTFERNHFAEIKSNMYSEKNENKSMKPVSSIYSFIYNSPTKKPYKKRVKKTTESYMDRYGYAPPQPRNLQFNSSSSNLHNLENQAFALQAAESSMYSSYSATPQMGSQSLLNNAFSNYEFNAPAINMVQPTNYNTSSANQRILENQAFALQSAGNSMYSPYSAAPQMGSHSLLNNAFGNYEFNAPAINMVQPKNYNTSSANQRILENQAFALQAAENSMYSSYSAVPQMGSQMLANNKFRTPPPNMIQATNFNRSIPPPPIAGNFSRPFINPATMRLPNFACGPRMPVMPPMYNPNIGAPRFPLNRGNTRPRRPFRPNRSAPYRQRQHMGTFMSGNMPPGPIKNPLFRN